MISLTIPGDFATIPDALASLGPLLTEDVELLVSGSLPDPITLQRFLSAGGDLAIRGAATLGPVNVRGPVGLVLDGVTVAGGAVGVVASHGARLGWSDLTIRDWTAFGLQVSMHAVAQPLDAGLLDILGPGSTAGWGVHLVMGGKLPIWNNQSGRLVRVTGCQYGFALGFQADYTHQGPGGSTTVRDCQRLTYATDHSTWSTTVPLVGVNCGKKYELNSISYMEAIGTRSWTNCGAGVAYQNSLTYPAGLP